MERIEKLRQLEENLLQAMEICENRELAPLAKQYRETIREIEEIEGAEKDDDELGELLSNRAVDGKSNTVR